MPCLKMFRYSRLQNNNLKSILDHFVIEKKANCDEFLINLKNLCKQKCGLVWEKL